jgi:hypothetical protein
MILPNMISLLVLCMSALVPVGSRDDWRGYDAESNDFILLGRWREGLVGIHDPVPRRAKKYMTAVTQPGRLMSNNTRIKIAYALVHLTCSLLHHHTSFTP